MTPLRSSTQPLIAPTMVAYFGLLLLPLCIVLRESLLSSAPGRVGGASTPNLVTLDNYATFLDRAYSGYFLDTFGLSLIACMFVVVVSYPVAYWLARGSHERLRKAALAVLMITLFASSTVKVYGVALAFGPNGLRATIAWALGLGSTSRPVTSIIVIVGLVNFLLPIGILGCVAPLQAVNPSLPLSAQSLGASRLGAHLYVVLPLCLRGLVEVFLLLYASAVSAFVVPWILGRGQINFISNLIYSRFSEISDFPGGAALSILLLMTSLFALVVLSALTAWLIRRRPAA